MGKKRSPAGHPGHDVSFAVARQTKEIGIRMAMVLGMVLKQGLALTLTGAAIGLGIALALSRVAASLLYGVSPTDALTFVLVPAQRAASLDPIRALRFE